MSVLHDWWNGLSPEEQENLHRIARKSILGLDRYPLVIEVILELAAWQELEADVLEAHADWLSRTKARFERRGVEWTVENFKRWSRMWECE